MALGDALLADTRRLWRPSAEWFSIAQIEKHDQNLKIAAVYIQKDTGRELVIPRNTHDIHERLDDWASRLLEQEVRSYEERLWEFCSENSAVPSVTDEAALKDGLMQRIDASVKDTQT